MKNENMRFETLAEAQEAAARMNEAENTDDYLVIDGKGKWVFEPFEVIKAPAVGDEVSRGFNGDYYPCGVVVKVSASKRRVVTDEGNVFYRRKESGSWKEQKSPFSLVKGVISRWNPEF